MSTLAYELFRREGGLTMSTISTDVQADTLD